MFRELFFSLPLTYLLNNKILVVHGGIPSDECVSLEAIKKVPRFSEPPEKGSVPSEANKG